MKWTKESALAEIDKLLDVIDSLHKVEAFSAEHVRWHQNVVQLLGDVFGKDSRYFGSFTLLTWQRDGSFLVGGVSDPEGSFNPQAAVEREHHKAYLKQLETARGLLLAAKDELGYKALEDVYEGKDTGPETSILLKIINLAEYKLRKLIRISELTEKDIQDAFENLLIGADVQYSREAESIEYSSKTYKPDFTFSKADLALDIKLCARSDREKEIIAEINDDILAYKKKFGNVLFIVYDQGYIRDIDRFIKEFENQEGVVVKVVKH